LSILFPKLNKPREWDYRPIYYDKEKEARKEKLARLHRGSFREEHEKNMSSLRARQKSKLTFWLILLLLALLLYLFLR